MESSQLVLHRNQLRWLQQLLRKERRKFTPWQGRSMILLKSLRRKRRRSLVIRWMILWSCCSILVLKALTRNLGMEGVSTDQSNHEVKSSGSMNLDEFLNSIWTAEENEAQPQNGNPMVPTAGANTSIANMNPNYHFGQTPNESSNVARQMCLTRQGFPSVPAPPCQETAKEVWPKISRTQQSSSNIPQASSRQREPSNGEMTLQEFLVKVGVVREEGVVAQIPPPRPHYLQPQYHCQPHPAPPVFHPRPHYQPQYRPQPHPAPPVFQPRPAPPLLPRPVFQPRPAPPLLPRPVFQPRPAPPLPRPQLPYGMYSNYNSTTVSNFMITGCGTGSVGVSGVRGSENTATSAVPLDGIGRKRMIDEPTDPMIERCRRKMIRNRESAIRSRARKQAYKIELEAEILQLKHEKADLGQRLKEMESKYKLQQLEAATTEAQANAEEKQGTLRRTFSCPY